MQQQISVITLGVAEIARSKRFYVDGFGWKPVLDTPEIVFYQMNGLMLGTMLGTWLDAEGHMTFGMWEKRSLATLGMTLFSRWQHHHCHLECQRGTFLFN